MGLGPERTEARAEEGFGDGEILACADTERGGGGRRGRDEGGDREGALGSERPSSKGPPLPSAVFDFKQQKWFLLNLAQSLPL